MPLYPVQKAIGGQQALLDEYLPNAERNIFGGKVTLRDMLDFVRGKTAEEQVAGFAGPAINPALPVAVGQIKGLYHGSPYKFSKFANEKIGTGEGAQAFGYGHYLSESPDIAKGYAKPKYRVWELSDKDYNFTPKFMETEDILEQTLTGDKYAMEQMRKDLRTKINSGYITNKDLIDEFNKIDKALFKGTVKEKNPSLIYETTVNKGKPSSADVLLEFDKPVSEEIKKLVGNKLREYNISQFFPDKITGQEFYEELVHRVGNNRNASQILKELGFTGNKYPSGTLSGIKDSPYYNYVIFNPEDITIEAVK